MSWPNTPFNNQTNMTKPLAVIGRIYYTTPIPGADKIHSATVTCGSAGIWTGVVSKELQSGSPVMVFLQDAVLPANDPRWAFMERHQWRVKMARFKGAPSECVILPWEDVGQPGDDWTQALGITKHTKPIPASLAGDIAGAFHSFIPKTDEPNFQAVPELVSRMASEPWYATEKADGTSCTVWNDEVGMHVCSRNWELKEFSASGAGNVYWRAARQYGLECLPPGYALQFEIVGPGIQGNPMGIASLAIRVFSLYDITQRKYAPLSALRALATKMHLPMAQIIVERGLTGLDSDELRNLANITYPNGKPGEGIVIRAIDSSWSFKVINLEYRE